MITAANELLLLCSAEGASAYGVCNNNTLSTITSTIRRVSTSAIKLSSKSFVAVNENQRNINNKHTVRRKNINKSNKQPDSDSENDDNEDDDDDDMEDFPTDTSGKVSKRKEKLPSSTIAEPSGFTQFSQYTQSDDPFYSQMNTQEVPNFDSSITYFNTFSSICTLSI